MLCKYEILSFLGCFFRSSSLSETTAGLKPRDTHGQQNSHIGEKFETRQSAKCNTTAVRSYSSEGIMLVLI